jgi:hypothetical protein
MTDYAEVRDNWWRLLRWHLKENGTRPDGHPDVPGDRWDDAEFALACSTGDPNNPRNAEKTVQNWYKEKGAIVTPKLKAIEKALMGSENRAYDAWRRDLREAHTSARYEKKPIGESTSLVIQNPSRSFEEPRDRKLFGAIMQQGFFLRLKGTICITPDFLSSIWSKCSDHRFVSKMTAPDQDTSEGSLVTMLLARITISAVQQRPWELELTLVSNETIFYLHRTLCKKAQEVGLFSIANNGLFVIDPDAEESFIHSFVARLLPSSSRRDFYSVAYEAWKFVTRAAIENSPEEDPRYVEILTLLMFATFYDSGSLETVAQKFVGNL